VLGDKERRFTEIFLELARHIALPVVEWIKTVAQAISNGKYRIQKTEWERH
jgi:hypothetical protein